MPSANIWIASSDNDLPTITTLLTTTPTLVNARDENGYTPIHAAASYGHTSLLRLLISTYNGDPNLRDSDGDTALFACETVEAAQVLVELGCDVNAKNSEGLTAAEAVEEDFPLVAAWLRSAGGAGEKVAIVVGEKGVDVRVREVEEELGPVDEELRRKIEELASRGDWEGEGAQAELRELITGVVREGVVGEGEERRVKAREE